MYSRIATVLATWAVVCALSGCSGIQSALDPAGEQAKWLADLFWWMAGGAIVVWIGVLGIAVYGLYLRPEPHKREAALLIIGGGVAVPTVVLFVLILFGMPILSRVVADAPEGSLKIRVVGEQWWWRVTYETPEGPVETANEIRLPVGQTVQFNLSSPDVIHSFWIPSLGGKMDTIPGRTTYLALTPTRTGRYRGACAEFCGDSHALMGLDVVVMEPAEFDAWLSALSSPAPAVAGAEVFLANGCGACHTVRGTAADGAVGPALTHFGSRLSIAASTLPNRPEPLARWIANPEAIKPGVYMPAYGLIPEEEMVVLVRYLSDLK